MFSSKEIFQRSFIYLNKLYKEFAGFQKSPQNAFFIILGIPLDITTTFRPGTRFAPSSIREASINIETYSFLANEYFESVNFYDAGDIDLTGIELKETLRRISLVIEDIYVSKKFPVVIGGEHTITYGIIKSLPIELLIIFDAHLDLRDEYPFGVKYGHATIMRRINEDLGISNFLFVGSRAWCKEEFDFTKGKKFKIITSNYIHSNLSLAIDEIKDYIKKFKRIYLSIDMDVFDPSFAPGVSNPEPYGLNIHEFFSILKEILSKKLIGIDLVEVTPNFDNGMTSILASKILFECLTYLQFKF